MARPIIPTTHPDFKYVRSDATDITKTLVKYGWTPPDRVKQQQARAELNP